MSKLCGYKFKTTEAKHRTITDGLLAYSQGELCLIECVKLDVQIRPVFADSNTLAI